MREHRTRLGLLRTRWSAVGAAVAVTLGAGGMSMAQAAIDTGDRPVTVTVDSERILDTRTNLGLAGRFADGTPRDLQVTGSVPVASGGSKTVVPADAIGVLVNVTVVTPTHDGFLSLRAKDAAGEPTTSTVNFTPGSIEPNAATVDLKDGQIQIWVETSSDSGSADVLIDVVGYTIGHTHDDRYYTEGEVDAALGAKANAADVYTKAEVDTQLAGMPFAVANSNQIQSVDGTGASVVSVTLTAPSDGNVTVLTSALPISTTAGVEARCSINDTATEDTSYEQRWSSGGTNIDLGSLSGTRMFTISSTSTATYHLFCRRLGSGTTISIYDTAISAIFTPAP